MNFKANKNMLACFFWGISITAYMFQCYWRSAANLIVPALIAFLLLEIQNIKFPFHKDWLKLYIIFLLYLTTSFAVSCLRGTSIGTAVRFYLILLAIPMALCIKEPQFKIEWKIMRIISIVKAFTILLTWMDVFIKQDYLQYRSWAKGMDVGDIYIIHGIPRVQLLGTSIFVILFICDFLQKRKITMYGFLMLLTALAAGNSAYVLGIAVFVVFYYLPKFANWIMKKNWRLLVAVPIALIGFVAFFYYASDSMKLKADYSNAVRIEQIQVLTDTNPLIGSGLGHSVHGGGRWRKYAGDTYFELQTLYIYNQVGIIGLTFFYILTIVPYMEKRNKWKLLAYFTYLIYTFFNPYCFDSTHIIAIQLITNCIPEITDK